MKERNEWKFLGRPIGTATGWDGEMDAFVLYDFEPAQGIDLPACDLQIEIEAGLFKGYDNDGNELWRKDILSVLS